MNNQWSDEIVERAFPADELHFTRARAMSLCRAALAAMPALKSPPVVSEGCIMLKMAAADDEARLWQKRFETLCRSHPIWRTADESGSWGLRDFLAYAAKICGFEYPPLAMSVKSEAAQGGVG